MAVLKLITAPDPLLSMASALVTKIDENIKNLASDMLDTMYLESGIGLSAVQVGVLKRVITVDVTQKQDSEENLIKGEAFIMINPEITIHSSKMSKYTEGCLSFPGERVEINRPASITVKYLDLTGKMHEIEADGIFATCIQHEVDHLNGITISNYVSHLRKELMIKRLLKQKKQLKF